MQDTIVQRSGISPALAVAAPTASAVSWGAVLAGAAGAAALSMILLILGTGLGLSSVSPWAGEGASAGRIGASAILWLAFTQLAASGIGGYLAGRLRTRWTDTAADEVYFRDTAHGFLAWAVASLATAALLTSVIGSILSGGAQAGAALAGAGAAGAATAAANAPDDGAQDARYVADTLFRRDPASPAPVPAAQEAEATLSEATRILQRGALGDALPPADRTYLGQLVAQRTGLAQADADQRVAAAFTQLQADRERVRTAAKEAADNARRASAYAALWFFVSLLAGAFFASLMATYGGRRRDLP
ncbi:hypothetical protein V4F39_03295 [Aquincola sp. MAHUQ-54]|uniref:Transmembrane protein n=1 Tax=Aquincola agrisoli TaxID=3119538 RepID=A0AAW9Q8C8_9BURK